MTEFGHRGIIRRNICIDSWGAGPFTISVDGKSYRFEDSDRFGPFWLNKDGSDAAKQPGGRTFFWRGYNSWRRQGRRVMSDGITCIWDEPRPRVLRRIYKNHFEVIDDGEDATFGKTIIVEI